MVEIPAFSIRYPTKKLLAFSFVARDTAPRQLQSRVSNDTDTFLLGRRNMFFTRWFSLRSVKMWGGGEDTRIFGPQANTRSVSPSTLFRAAGDAGASVRRLDAD